MNTKSITGSKFHKNRQKTIRNLKAKLHNGRKLTPKFQHKNARYSSAAAILIVPLALYLSLSPHALKVELHTYITCYLCKSI